MFKCNRTAVAGRFCAILALLALSLTVGLINAAAQSVPYSAVLRTDPDVGNIQGIQRYGRTLRTDPDEEFHGGWELLKFLAKGEDPALAHARHAPQRSGKMRRRGGRFGPQNAPDGSAHLSTLQTKIEADEPLPTAEPPQ